MVKVKLTEDSVQTFVLKVKKKNIFNPHFLKNFNQNHTFFGYFVQKRQKNLTARRRITAPTVLFRINCAEIPR